MQKRNQQKNRELWYKRLFLLWGIGSISFLAVVVSQLHTVVQHRPKQPWSLTLSYSLEKMPETAVDSDEYVKDKDNVIELTGQYNLPKIDTVVVAWENVRKLIPELMQVQVQNQDLKPMLAKLRMQTWELEQDLKRDLMQVLTLDTNQDVIQTEKLVRVQSQKLDLELLLVRARERDLERATARAKVRAEKHAQARGIDDRRAQLQSLTLAKDLVAAQEQKLGLALESALRQANSLSDDTYFLLMRTASAELQQKHGVTLKQGSELKKLINNEPMRKRAFAQAGVLLGISAAVLSLLIVALGPLIVNGLSQTSPLIVFLPEECVAETRVLYNQKRESKVPRMLIWICLSIIILDLFWRVYIQIRLDNLRLLSRQRSTDD